MRARRTLGIDPLVPGVVVIGKVFHVGEPDLRGQELGFAGAGRAQKRVDLSEHLSGLLLVSPWIAAKLMVGTPAAGLGVPIRSMSISRSS
jgi:hypothetical protein